ncbi:TRAP transporter small permease [Leucothrix sargassi]|nr:TRAP transporter small permease [Leucothrix sargassi]
MSSSTQHVPQGWFGRFVNSFEENTIALILALMTIITFTNVVLRKGFDSSLSWGLEATSFLFAWLVLFGMSYCVKTTMHLGVDALVSHFSVKLRRIVALVASVICLVYAFLLLKGSWDYWANFANLPGTLGRVFPLGFEQDFLAKGWYEAEEVPMPEILRFIEPIMNEGEAYEKIPRFIPYMILPIGVALLFFRLVQATYRIYKSTAIGLIASHEVEDAIDEIKASREEETK